MRRFLSAFFCVLSLLFAAAMPAAARVSVDVDLTSQTMRVTTSSGENYNWAISSGKPGYRTPNGVYRVQVMKTYHYSRKYHGAMPHSLFFRGGYAIHGTNMVGRLGRPDSHGCVRLAPANAATLFALVRQHGPGSTRIAIAGVAPAAGKVMADAPTKPAGKKKVAAAKVAPAAASDGTFWPQGRGAGKPYFGPPGMR